MEDRFKSSKLTMICLEIVLAYSECEAGITAAVNLTVSELDPMHDEVNLFPPADQSCLFEATVSTLLRMTVEVPSSLRAEQVHHAP